MILQSKTKVTEHSYEVPNVTLKTTDTAWTGKFFNLLSVFCLWAGILVYLVKVQTYNDVGLLCLLMDHLQEVNMANVCEGFLVKATQAHTLQKWFLPNVWNTILITLHIKDTEEVECPGHIDNSVSRLRLCSWGKLDDLLGRLEELRHSCPWTVPFRTLEHNKRQSIYFTRKYLLKTRWCPTLVRCSTANTPSY